MIAELGRRKKLVKMPVGYLNETTGPKAKFILILCATSGMVEKATNPERTEIRQSCKNEKYLCNVSLIEVGLALSFVSYCNGFGHELGNSSELFWKDYLPSVLSTLNSPFFFYSGLIYLIGESEG